MGLWDKLTGELIDIIEWLDDSRDDLQTQRQLASLVQQMLDRGILFDDAQREFERVFIARALAKTNYNVCKAARMTGLHRTTLARKMAEYKIRKSA